jgi:AraC-like DNA-binding protein
MTLDYQDIAEDGTFILTNYNCQPGQRLLKKKDFYKIIWAQDRDRMLTIDGYEINLMKNQMLFCTPLNVLKIPKEPGITSVVFNKEFYCLKEHDEEVSCNGLLFYGASTPPVINLDEMQIESYERMFGIFKEEFEGREKVQGEMLHLMLKRLLIKSVRLLKGKKAILNVPKNEVDLIRKFHILVEQNFRELHQVADYAEKLHKSPKTLSNLFKKAGYPSPLQVVNDRVALEGKRLLLFSDLSAKEVGHQLGYKEGTHFSKFFKSQIGQPPIKWREEQKTIIDH